MAINEQLQQRLQNLQAIEPILSALRSVSLSKNLTSRRQRVQAQRYSKQLKWIFAQVRTPIEAVASQPKFSWLTKVRRLQHEEGLSEPRRPRIVAIVGSERGLCGRYNREVVKAGLTYFDHSADQAIKNDSSHLWVFGRRTLQLVERKNQPVSTFHPLSITTLPTFDFAAELSARWLSLYEKGAIDGVDLIYNRPTQKGKYKPEIVTVIPPSLSDLEDEPSWPPTIIETDPAPLFAHLVRQWVAVAIYTSFLEAAETEHRARYLLMESAEQNAERLLGELQLASQAERRQQITQEVQELTAGATLGSAGRNFRLK